MQLRELTNFPGVFFDPTKRDILYAEDYNVIIRAMKPIDETCSTALLGVVDASVIAPAGTEQLLYQVPLGYDVILSHMYTFWKPGHTNQSDAGMTLTRKADLYQIQQIVMPSYSSGDNSFVVSLIGMREGQEMIRFNEGDQLVAYMDNPAGEGEGSIRVFLFGMLIPKIV